MANRNCNLECVKGKKGDGEAIEFVGPVKIVLVDRSNTSEYKRVIWYAAAIGVAEMLLATVTVIAQFFALGQIGKSSFLKGMHALSGSIGLQACLLSGILVLNAHSGPAAPVSVEGRKSEHVCVQICGLLFSVGGVVCAYLTDSKSITTLHSILGFAATGFAILAGLSGIFLNNFCGYSSSEDNFGFWLYVHIILAIVACITSSMCFVSGITSNIFRKWLPVAEMYHYMTLCCAIYTTIILYKPIIMLTTGSRDGFTNY